MTRHHRPVTHRQQMNRHGRKMMRLHYRHKQRQFAPGSFHHTLCGMLAKNLWERKPDDERTQPVEMPPPLGREEGAQCNRDGCEGTLGYVHPPECYCHLSPPCHHCTDNPLVCPECGWDEDEPEE